MVLSNITRNTKSLFMSRSAKIFPTGYVPHDSSRTASKRAALISMVSTIGFNPDKLLDVSEGLHEGRKICDFRVISIKDLSKEALLKLIESAEKGKLAGYRTDSDGVERLYVTPKALKKLETANSFMPAPPAAPAPTADATIAAVAVSATGDIINTQTSDVETIDDTIYEVALSTFATTMDRIAEEERLAEEQQKLEKERESYLESKIFIHTPNGLGINLIGFLNYVSNETKDKKHKDGADEEFSSIKILRKIAERLEAKLQKRDLEEKDQKHARLKKDILKEQVLKAEVRDCILKLELIKAAILFAEIDFIESQEDKVDR